MTEWVAIAFTRDDAQALYDLTGTLPFAPDSWTHRVRSELSSVLGWLEPDAQPIIYGYGTPQADPDGGIDDV